jgi:iron uptake system component EfeO
VTRALGTVCALVAGAALLAGCGGGSSSSASGSAVSDVDVSITQCGEGWEVPADGRADLAVTSSYGPTQVADVYLANAKTGQVYEEIEGLAPGSTVRIAPTLGSGSYQFQCFSSESDPELGPVVHVTSTATKADATPGVVPVTFADLVPISKAYQRWIESRLPTLLAEVRALRATVSSGSAAEAEAAWLKAHLTYETLGAAYDAFGELNDQINGFPAGSESWREDTELTGFHLVEGLLWSGAPTAEVTAAVAQLEGFVEELITQFKTTEIEPFELPLRSHEIIENAIQFELTGQTDAGSHTNLATVHANIQGARKALSFVAPLLRSRYAELPAAESALVASEKFIGGFDRGGRWAPLESLSTMQRQRVNASLEGLVELLAPVAAIGDIRYTPQGQGEES